MLWISLLNILRIVISNPSIDDNISKLSVYFQNAKGLIPFSELGKAHPMSNTNKVSEFQSYLFDKKPNVVILNKTCLSKNINNNAIFPAQTYKMFRLDRINKIYPQDIDDPDRYNVNGGDLNCATNLIKVKCKAEILSVEIGLRNGKCVCLYTFYTLFYLLKNFFHV